MANKSGFAKARIVFSGGRAEETHESLGEAMTAIKATWPDAYFYANDDRVLVWENEARSEEDDGMAAVASIYPD